MSVGQGYTEHHPSPCGCEVAVHHQQGSIELGVELLSACPLHASPVRPGDYSCSTEGPIAWERIGHVEPGDRVTITVGQYSYEQTADEAAMADRIATYVNSYVRGLRALEDIGLVRMLAADPWLLHHLAASPEWAAYAEQVRHRAGVRGEAADSPTR